MAHVLVRCLLVFFALTFTTKELHTSEEDAPSVTNATDSGEQDPIASEFDEGLEEDIEAVKEFQEGIDALIDYVKSSEEGDTAWKSLWKGIARNFDRTWVVEFTQDAATGFGKLEEMDKQLDDISSRHKYFSHTRIHPPEIPKYTDEELQNPNKHEEILQSIKEYRSKLEKYKSRVDRIAQRQLIYQNRARAAEKMSKAWTMSDKVFRLIQMTTPSAILHIEDIKMNLGHLVHDFNRLSKEYKDHYDQSFKEWTASEIDINQMESRITKIDERTTSGAEAGESGGSYPEGPSPSEPVASGDSGGSDADSSLPPGPAQSGGASGVGSRDGTATTDGNADAEGEDEIIYVRINRLTGVQSKPEVERCKHSKQGGVKFVFQLKIN